MRSHRVYLFLSGLFHLAQYSRGSSLLVVANGKIEFFLWQNNIPVSVYVTFSLSIHPSMDICFLVLAPVNSEVTMRGAYIFLN